MEATIIASIISGAVSLICSLLAFRQTTNKMMQDMAIHQAVNDERIQTNSAAQAEIQKTLSDIAVEQGRLSVHIEELTREVREHNNFAQRVPVLEAKVEGLERSKT